MNSLRSKKYCSLFVMGVEDLSLDDIIKQRNVSKKKRPQNSGMYSDKGRAGPTFQKRKKPFVTRQQKQQQGGRKIIDARLLITKRGKTQLTDARQRITPKVGDARQKITATKPVADARQKLQAMHSKGQQGEKLEGKIPKVTISNELAIDKPYQKSNVLYHVTGGASRARAKPRRFLGGQPGVLRRETGIRIAVKNDRANTNRRSASPPSSMLTKNTFERLKITTINKEAMKRKPLPPRHKSPVTRTTRPLRKRSMPESDDSFDEDEPVYGKQQRRQQRADSPPQTRREKEQEIYEARFPSRTDQSDLRPMISKQVAKQAPVIKKEIVPGPSPIEGTKLKVINLHPVVTEDDILELFSVLGAVRRARLVKPGEADVVYIRHDNAMSAYKKYNNRDLDGQPMQIKIVSSEQPRQPLLYSWMKDIKTLKKKSDTGEVTELHSGVLQQALFKGGSTGTSTRPVVFTVKI